jgi:Acyl-coenzyme A synthetases/AMP-(fatty) acid ligases
MAEETEVRTYEPPEEFARNANINDASVYEEAEKDHEGFWEDKARQLHWFKEWDQVLNWDPPEAQWFVGGKTNVAYNCLDYQVEQGRATSPPSSGSPTSRARARPTPTRS